MKKPRSAGFLFFLQRLNLECTMKTNDCRSIGKVNYDMSLPQ
jgi:hypothetical protein